MPTFDEDGNVDVQSNAGRSDWAKSTCRIITDGPEFAECRQKVTDYQLFYKDCLYDLSLIHI